VCVPRATKSKTVRRRMPSSASCYIILLYSTVAIAPTRGQRPLFPSNRNVFLRNVRNSRYLGYWKAQFSYNDSVTFPWSEEFVIHAFESPDSAQAGT
jgi:hypothetical protein